MQRRYPTAAIIIQRTYRGLQGRRLFWRCVDSFIDERIKSPACIRIQRLYRGYCSRLLAIDKRWELRCVEIIQHNVRRWLYRRLLARRTHVRLQLTSATSIQRVYRGSYHRQISTALRRRHVYENVFVPSVIRVQAWVRGKSARVTFRRMKDWDVSATLIQRTYRAYQLHARAVQRWAELLADQQAKKVVILQKTVRMFLAKLRFHRVLLTTTGIQLMAAKTIARAWSTFRSGRKLEALLIKHRLHIFAARLVAIQSSRDELEEDIDEIKSDIIFVGKALVQLDMRVSELKAFEVQVENRIPTIMKQMTELTDHDFEHAWDEALALEQHSLSCRLIHAREEIRILRNNAMSKKRVKLLLMHLDMEPGIINECIIGTI
jgi:hypothetical protein